LWGERWLDDMLDLLEVILDPALVRPRAVDVSAVAERDHCIVYTDASGAGWIGMILIDLRSGGPRLWASVRVPAWFTKVVSGDTMTAISQYELLGHLAADLTFEHLLTGRAVYHFGDNTSAIAAVVHGTSGKPAMARLANMVCMVSARNHTRKFYEYCKTHANPSDCPSRPRPSLSSPPTPEELLAAADWDRKYKADWDSVMPFLVQLPTAQVILPTQAQWEQPSLFYKGK